MTTCIYPRVFTDFFQTEWQKAIRSNDSNPQNSQFSRGKILGHGDFGNRKLEDLFC